MRQSFGKFKPPRPGVKKQHALDPLRSTQQSWHRSNQSNGDRRHPVKEMQATGTSSFLSTKQSFSTQNSRKASKKNKKSVRRTLFLNNSLESAALSKVQSNASLKKKSSNVMKMIKTKLKPQEPQSRVSLGPVSRNNKKDTVLKWTPNAFKPH